MNIKRTDKQFTADNLSPEFIKKAMCIACAESHLINDPDEDFSVEITFEGRIKGGSMSPWQESCADLGYDKKVSIVRLNTKKGFDSYAKIFDKSGSIQGYYHESDRQVCIPNPVKWINLLLENGFIELES